jgi:class 3 adenylate cyclase/tetratricopeptide (TPR) repeat protein
VNEPRRERKVVTVLFADLVGFTARSVTLDPEDVEAILRPYHARLREELEQRGGTVEKFVGDAVMAVFGAPTAHEDDPERAVRAALAIRDGIVEDGTLEVRVGVNTGEALVNIDARPDHGEGMVAGDVVNTAARLQSAAPTNGILVGEVTRRATAGVIVYHAHDAVDAKGKAEPVPVWEAVEARAHVGVELPAPTTPLFGRERERELLIGTFARVRGERATQLVTVVGVPGIGKSRLVAELYGELSREAELTYWRHGRSLSYGEGVAFWAFAEMVKAQAGILDTDDTEAAAQKLHEAAEVTGEDAAWVEARLRPLVGLETGPVARDETFAGWRRFVEALADHRPTVLVFEDLHWADDALLDFVDELVEWLDDVPLLVVGTARPELFDRRPDWGGGKRNAVTISLAPLADDDTARLLASLLERSVLPAEQQQALLARAGGNPLYAEQFVRMLDERGEVQELPETVQGIIAARLDSLPQGEKELLLDAAVLGKTFWVGALGGDDMEARLRALQRKEFVRRERRSSVGGETEYAFAHLLVRDVAYAQIPRAERASKHETAARWLESLTDRSEDLAELLVHHYLAALDLMRAAGSDATELVEPAVGVLFDAIERALRLNAFARAQQYATTLLGLLDSDDPRRARALLMLAVAESDLGEPATAEHGTDAAQAFAAQGDIMGAAEAETFLANAFWQVSRRDDAHAAAARAIDLLRDEPPSRAKAAAFGERSRLAMLAGNSQEAIDVGLVALELARQFADERLEARALITVGTARGHSGEEDNASLTRGIEIAERANAMTEYVRGMNNLAQGRLVAGDTAGTAELYDTALERVDRIGLKSGLAWMLGMRVSLMYYAGEWDRLEPLAERYRSLIARMPGHYLEHQLAAIEADLMSARGEPGAEDSWAHAIELCRSAGDPQAIGPPLSYRARVLFDEGRLAEAVPLVDEVLALRDEHGAALYYTWLISLSWLLVDLGREVEMPSADRGGVWLEVAEAIVCGNLVAAAEELERIGLRPFEAYTRLRIAEQLASDGRQAEAQPHLDRALAFYRSVGATAYVRRAERLLPASA